MGEEIVTDEVVSDLEMDVQTSREVTEVLIEEVSIDGMCGVY